MDHGWGTSGVSASKAMVKDALLPSNPMEVAMDAKVKRLRLRFTAAMLAYLVLQRRMV